ncbi:MAG: hypothetical protein KJZ64_10175 [Sphingomonadaceae bacterium]|nr:hypothetical protein [Sphingomonadaceae bacterium]
MIRARALGAPNGTFLSKSEAFMDIHDINLEFGISLTKLRRMEKAGVLRVGKSQLPKHWQMVRSDIRKGKLSARSIALAYRFPKFVPSITDLSKRQRAVIEEHFASADLSRDVPEPVESTPAIATIVCSAATDGRFVDRFIQILQAQIPDKDVGHHYVAVRILLMCRNEFGMDIAYEYLRRALSKVKDRPEMAGWWRSEKAGERNERRTIYRRPDADFDL